MAKNDDQDFVKYDNCFYAAFDHKYNVHNK